MTSSSTAISLSPVTSTFQWVCPTTLTAVSSFTSGEKFPSLSTSITCTPTTTYPPATGIVINGTVNPTTFTNWVFITPGSLLSYPYTCDYRAVRGATPTITAATSSSTLPPQSSAISSSTESSAISPSTKFNGTTAVPAPGPPSTGGISSAAAAGIGIGVGLVGILIGAAVAYLLTRRQNHRQGAINAAAGDNSAPPSTAKFDPSNIVAGQANPLSQYLLDGAGDSEVTAELSSLGFLIEQHVQSHYHQRPLNNISESLDSSLAQLGVPGDARKSILGLALSPKTRSVAIRSLLAWVIFSNLSIHTPSSLSLLPPSVTAFVQSLPVPKAEERKVPFTKALVLWRRLAAFLLHENPQERSVLPLSGTVKPQIIALVSALNVFLVHFGEGDRTSISAQKQHLEGVIVECAKFGYSLFSHPCEWQFTFRPISADRRAVVVVPGLEKLSNKEGSIYDTVQVIVQPVVFHLAGISS